MVVYWPFDPTVDIGLLAVTMAYAWLGPRAGVTVKQAVYFGLGLLIVWAALETPLDPIGDYDLQSAHMVQHMLLLAYAPPLLLLGLSPGLVDLLLRLPGLRSITRPIPAMTIYAGTVIAWHVPAMYELAISNPLVHVVEHLAFIAAGTIFWWPAIDVTSRRSPQPMGYGARIVYVFLGTIPMLAVALPLQFSSALFYPSYSRAPIVVSGINHVIDQSIAGVLMFMMDMGVMAFDALVVFFRWMREEERAADAELAQGSWKEGSSVNQA